MHFTTIYTRLSLWLASVLWLPVLTYAADKPPSGSPFMSAVTLYQSELILSSSIVTAVVGAWLAAHWNPPEELEPLIKRNSKTVNVVSSLCGAFAAFVYMLHQEQKLIILHPLWVLGISFATPLTLQVAIPVAFQVLSDYISRYKSNRGGQDGT